MTANPRKLINEGYAMKIKPKIKQAAVVAIIIMMFAGMQPRCVAIANADKPKTEMVYAILENDGTYTGATVVNSFVQSGEITDYGTYTSVKNLMGPDDPLVNGDKITWPEQMTRGHERFYYEGETDKSLPIDIDIKYYLNTVATPSYNIVGKTGELTIDFDIRNNTGCGETDALTGKEIYTPFAATISLTLDKDVFTIKDIPKNATVMTVGSSQTVTYSMFPLPNDTFSITLFGQDIALEPINIMVLPKAPPGLEVYSDFVDVDEMSDGTDEMIEGTEDMSAGTDDLLDGLYEMKHAVKEMKTGLNDLSGGAASLENGTDTLAVSAKKLSDSANEFYIGLSVFAASFAEFDQGMKNLNTSVLAMTASLSDINDAAARLNNGVIGMGDGLDGIASSNEDLAVLANTVAATYPDANTAALLAGLNAQQVAMDGLAASNVDLQTLASSVQSGTQDFYAEFSATFSASVLALEASGNALYTSCIEMLSGADALNAGCTELSNAANSLARGADDVKSGAGQAADAVPKLLDAIEEMIEGVADLQDGITALRQDGLTEMKDTLRGLDGYLEKLSEKAEEYGSFMDDRNAKTSSVQFVLKTKGTKTKE